MKDDIRILKRVFIIAKSYHKHFAVIGLYIVAGTLLGLLGPYFFGKTIDSLSENDYQTAFILVAISIGILIVSYILETIQGKYEIKHVRFGIQRFFAKWSLEKILLQSLGQFRSENSGYRQKIFNKGESSMQNVMQSVVYSIIPTILRSLLTTIAIYFLSPILGVVITAGLIVYCFIIFRINKNIESDLTKLIELWGKEGREYAENLRYLSLIKTNVQEEKVIKHYDRVYGEVKSAGVSVWTRFETLALGRDIIVTVFRGGALLLSIWLVMQGELTLGTVVIFFTWSNGVFQGLQQLGRIQRNMADWLSAIKKMFDMLDEKPVAQEVEDPISLENMHGEIRFDHVTFHYPNRKKDVAKELSKNSTKEKETRDPALEDVSFTIKSGTTTAFVGKSGSGKTTLINLLLRAYDPQDGTIYIDDVDLKQLKLDSYRKQVGVVEQEVEVFDKTIKHNILFPIDDPEAYDMQQLHEIAHDAGVAEFEDRLEDGYDTKIGEKGIQLSGGQKQRVGIARVLAKKPKILIFDEATASLDSINEKNIHEAMNRALKGRTGIIIAHRLATIMDADKIIVMDNGKVVGEGTHAKLLKTCSEYQELVKLQNLN